MENIHRKIKNLRLENEMTLKDLSEQTGLSVSFLSQIERGSSSLAITSLKKISDAFNMNITYFFEEIENHNYALHKEEQKRFKLEGSDVTHVRLAGKFPERKIEPMMVTIPPNKQFTEKYSHPGEEFYYVLKGIVIFKIEEKEYVLNVGDSIHFPSEKVHEWKNPTNEESVLISVLTPVIF
ncbi:cupin domain-containing protein [Virgibacillus dakarensis]|uniref:DNA-binding protein n=1 Tax=Lentibacillus populi TaxID=1827502 RepID=A0A9W5TXR6_9BACI|nr:MULTISPECIES: XRE family transcriptional regulator [Bacillaceae]MBT2218402.1 XRE family transcriptional regulator [Virgibacillus dakarensis]MTW84487.1 cupin domain-containing protein [Virgibacillus dakarensis]GGB42414.1 DNA-binding protein [Lentibacillus populi]